MSRPGSLSKDRSPTDDLPIVPPTVRRFGQIGHPVSPYPRDTKNQVQRLVPLTDGDSMTSMQLTVTIATTTPVSSDQKTLILRTLENRLPGVGALSMEDGSMVWRGIPISRSQAFQAVLRGRYKGYISVQ